MEQSGILDVENPIHIFTLHLVFTSRINTALTEFANMFNNHRLSTEHGWTPNQIWLNGILNENDPLSSCGGVDESVVHRTLLRIPVVQQRFLSRPSMNLFAELRGCFAKVTIKCFKSKQPER